jgi:lipopolysaccharide export system protein LptC
MERSWRWIYVVCAVLALYLNVFVAVVRSFTKITTVHALARAQKETHLSRHATRGDNDFRGDWYFRGEEVPHQTSVCRGSLEEL